MKIAKKTNNNKTLKITLISLLVLLGLAGGYYYYDLKTNPANDVENASLVEDSEFPKNNNPTPATSENNKNNDSEESTESAETDTDSVNSSSSDTSNDYIVPKLSEGSPELNAKYPIENERYRIAKISSAEFNVKLYVILNNPNYSNYKEQLRTYKQEVLEYLEARYGSTENLTINWTPKEANDV